MSLQVEKLEHNMAKLTIEAGADELEKALNSSYLKNRSRISVPGFRKGKAPRKLIEKMYGKEVFYEEAARELMNESYAKEIKEHRELSIVSNPKVDVVQIEAGKPFIYTAEVALKPEVELGKYKGIKVTKIDTTVSAEEIDREIDSEREKNARITNVEGRASKLGDIVTIDFEGFVDDVAFDGGKGTDHDLELGSHSFIDTFEDQLVGKNIDDDVDVNVTFPEEYQEKSLAGKAALFKVKVKNIKEKILPEIDDEFASEVSGFDTLKEYKDDIEARLKRNKEADAKAKKEDELVEALVKDSNMDIPDAMIETQAEQMVENYANRMRQQGLSLQQYMQYTGMTYEKMVDQMKAQAKANIESRLVLEAVVDAEKIEASDEDFEKEMKDMAESYMMEVDKLKEIMGETEQEAIKKDIAVRKAADFLLENAKETAAKKTEDEDEDDGEEKPKRGRKKKAEETEE
ncbi:MAG: trigger factor [Lachnospiraceae bacterium]|nr:trigger factor [Lachnospiraceae bacterium]